MKILLQFPEGLKQKALEYVAQYENQAQVYLSSSKSFGGCDVAFDEAKAIGADKIIHFGHAPFPLHKDRQCSIPVQYVEYYVDLKPEFVQMIVDNAKQYNTIALTSVVQHIKQFNEIKKMIEESGTKVLTAKGPKCHYEGQCLGCDAVAGTSLEDKVDAVFFIGSGRFHYQAFHKGLDVLKVPIYISNPYDNSVKDVSQDIKQYIKKRQGIVVKASEAKNIGILVSTRPGQFNIELAEQIKDKLNNIKSKDKLNVQILVSRTIDPEALQDYNLFDAYINTACPRIADDYEVIGKPIINVFELDLFYELLS